MTRARFPLHRRRAVFCEGPWCRPCHSFLILPLRLVPSVTSLPPERCSVPPRPWAGPSSGHADSSRDAGRATCIADASGLSFRTAYTAPYLAVAGSDAVRFSSGRHRLPSLPPGPDKHAQDPRPYLPVCLGRRLVGATLPPTLGRVRRTARHLAGPKRLLPVDHFDAAPHGTTLVSPYPPGVSARGASPHGWAFHLLRRGRHRSAFLHHWATVTSRHAEGRAVVEGHSTTTPPLSPGGHPRCRHFFSVRRYRTGRPRAVSSSQVVRACSRASGARKGQPVGGPALLQGEQPHS